MQGTIVLAVVVAYEISRRLALVSEQRRVAAQLGGSVEGGATTVAAGTGASS